MKKAANLGPSSNETEAFTKVEDQSGEGQPSSLKKVRLPISADGQIDWSSVSEDQKPLIVSALASDEEVLNQIISSSGGESGSEDNPEDEGPKKYLRPEHADTFLNILSMVEKKFLPPVIKKILKRPMAPEVIDEAFQFSEEQVATITPPLLKFGEETIPEKYKIMLAYGSDRFEAFGLIAWAMKQQIENAVKLQLDYEKIHPPQPEIPDEEKPENKGKVM